MKKLNSTEINAGGKTQEAKANIKFHVSERWEMGVLPTVMKKSNGGKKFLCSEKLCFPLFRY